MTPPSDCCPADPTGPMAPPNAPGILTRAQALERLLARARPVVGRETLPLSAALDRVLAAPIHSPIDVPGWDNSAMDGYALRVADLAPAGGRLRVAQRIPAGRAGAPLVAGTAARIFTGAPIPPGADTVVIQEVCQVEGETLIPPAVVKPGANIRRAGEDIRAGAEIIATGTLLLPQHLGLAASVGIGELCLYRRPRVAVLASGDELVMPGQPLGPGQIYNSNRFTLRGLLDALGCEVIDLGQVADNLEATLAALQRGAAEADLVLASGGVSVGEEDHVKPAVERLGRLDLWKVAIRPGKPLACGHLGPGAATTIMPPDWDAPGTPFIGMPGNPVSLFVTFCLFVRPFIRRLRGISGDLAPRPWWLPAGFEWPKAGGREEFPRARLVPDAERGLEVRLYPSHSSAVLSSVTWAEGLAVIPIGQTLRQGDPVQFLPLRELQP